MSLFNSRKERQLASDNKVKQFTIDCQDMRLQAQKYLMETKEEYIKETEEIVEEQQQEIEALRAQLETQRDINRQMDIQLSIMKEKGGDFGLN